MIYKVKVFLSWSGKESPSHAVAKGLNDWIQKVIHLAEPFLSSDDILAGERWNDILGKELNESNFGILCITKKTLLSPWMLFEAGILAGGLKNIRRVCPYLIDFPVEELPPPLNQFNAVTADIDGTYKMMKSLNNTNEGQLIPDEILKSSFKVWWNDLNTVINGIKEQR